MKHMMFWFLLLNTISIFTLSSVLSSAHKQTGFQGELSLLSQEDLLTPFPLKARNHSLETISGSTDYGAEAILSADREFIKDGGEVKIMANIIGISILLTLYYL